MWQGIKRALPHWVGGNRKRNQQSTNTDQKSIETVFSIAICRQFDKWQSKTPFLLILIYVPRKYWRFRLPPNRCGNALFRLCHFSSLDPLNQQNADFWYIMSCFCVEYSNQADIISHQCITELLPLIHSYLLAGYLINYKSYKRLETW